MEDKLHAKNVLLVDDDDRNIYALANYLEMANGMNVTIAKDGIEAMEKLLSGDLAVDIILLDMMMPEMDGFETIAAIKKEEKLLHIPIIAVTAKAMKGDREKCLEAGAWDYVPKPLDMKLLTEILFKWV